METTLKTKKTPVAYINNYDGAFKDQRWMVAHNGWNTGQAPANQVKSITELLDYGVRGLALDIYLNHGVLELWHVSYLYSNKNWAKILGEIVDWLAANPTEIVTLFFESHLPGPVPNDNSSSALYKLHESLTTDAAGYYVPGKQAQTALLTGTDTAMPKTLTELANAGQRLFAFLEKEPDEGVQDLFPVMSDVFAENVYGDSSLDIDDWVKLRTDPVPSGTDRALTFMNHFGDRPTGSEWDRNAPDLIKKHAQCFAFSFNGRYPNFISLDVINWDDKDPEKKSKGPVVAFERLRKTGDIMVTDYAWAGANDFDDVEIDMPEDAYAPAGAVTYLHIEKAGGQGITKIVPGRSPGHEGIIAVQVYNQPKYGIVNLRYQKESGKWTDWLTEYETPAKENAPDDKNLATHRAAYGCIVGTCCRMQHNRGVTDFAVASRVPGPKDNVLTGNGG